MRAVRHSLVATSTILWSRSSVSIHKPRFRCAAAGRFRAEPRNTGDRARTVNNLPDHVEPGPVGELTTGEYACALAFENLGRREPFCLRASSRRQGNARLTGQLPLSEEGDRLARAAIAHDSEIALYMTASRLDQPPKPLPCQLRRQVKKWSSTTIQNSPAAVFSRWPAAASVGLASVDRQTATAMLASGEPQETGRAGHE